MAVLSVGHASFAERARQTPSPTACPLNPRPPTGTPSQSPHMDPLPHPIARASGAFPLQRPQTNGGQPIVSSHALSRWNTLHSPPLLGAGPPAPEAALWRSLAEHRPRAPSPAEHPATPRSRSQKRRSFVRNGACPIVQRPPFLRFYGCQPVPYRGDHPLGLTGLRCLPVILHIAVWHSAGAVLCDVLCFPCGWPHLKSRHFSSAIFFGSCPPPLPPQNCCPPHPLAFTSHSYFRSSFSGSPWSCIEPAPGAHQIDLTAFGGKLTAHVGSPTAVPKN